MDELMDEHLLFIGDHVINMRTLSDQELEQLYLDCTQAATEVADYMEIREDAKESKR